MEKSKIRIPILSEKTDCTLLCTFGAIWPPNAAMMALRFPEEGWSDYDGLWASGKLTPSEHEGIKVWQKQCGQVKMGVPCFSCDKAQLVDAPGMRLRTPVPLVPLLKKEAAKHKLPYNHALGFKGEVPSTPAKVEEQPEPSPEPPEEIEKKAEEETAETLSQMAKDLDETAEQPELKPVNLAELISPKKKPASKKRSSKKKSAKKVEPEAPKAEEPKAEEPKADVEEDEIDDLLKDL